jgi:hypothetical protein
MGFLVGGKDGLWKASPGGEPDKALLTARDFGESNVGLFDLAISQDGSRLAFRLMSVKYGVSVWISSKEGQTPVPLWRDPRGSPQRGPVWSPDGNWIAYYGMRAGKAAIFKVRVGSNEPAEFVTDRTRLRPVRWSPRGDWLVTDTQPGLNLVSPDGKVVKRLSELTWLTFGFSRDGQDLYGVREGENRRLVVSRVNVDTGAEKMLSDLGPAPADFRMGELQAEFSMRGFSLSPDGKSFLTSVYAEKGDIWIASGLRRQSGLGWWGRVWGKPAN